MKRKKRTIKQQQRAETKKDAMNEVKKSVDLKLEFYIIFKIDILRGYLTQISS